jgi:Leucine-rich repeat (LRR) protein
MFHAQDPGRRDVIHEDNDPGNNRIENVAPLSGLRNLRNLDLSNNSITDIRPLEKLRNLRSVNLKGNKIPVIQLNNLRQVFPELQIEADSTISTRITAPSRLRMD